MTHARSETDHDQGHRWRGRRPPLPVLLVYVMSVAYAGYLLYLGQAAWFWGDDWEFLLHRGTIDGENQGLFRPHNGHWSTMPILIVHVLYSLFGMTTYVPYVLVTIGIHVSIALALNVLLRRCGLNPWVALLGAGMVLFIPVGPDNILWDAAMNNTGALLCGFLATLVLHRHVLHLRPLLGVWALLIVALMFSGTGISAIVLAGAFAATARGPLAGLKVVSVPVAVFTLWYAVEGHRSGGLGWHTDNVSQFVWAGLTRALGSATGVPEAGPVLFVALLLAMFIDRQIVDEARYLAWAGLAAASTQLLLEGLARGFMGVEAASSSRYAYFTVVLLAPAAAAALDRLWRLAVEPRWLVAVAATALALGYAWFGVQQIRPWAGGYAAVTQEWRGRVLGTVANVQDGQAIIADHGDGANQWLEGELLTRPEVAAKLPQDAPTLEDRMRAETMFNVGVGEAGYGLFRPALMDLSFGWDRASEDGPGCHDYTATVDNPMLQLATEDGIEIGVTSDATEVTTIMKRGEAESEGRIWQVSAGSLHIASTAKDAVLKVSFNSGGNYVICKK